MAFDESTWTLTVGGQPVALESKPLAVLYELLVRPGEVVTKDELLTAVWPGVFASEASLATAISKLRRAFGDSGSTVIATVSRMGYRLTVPVTREAVAQPVARQLTLAVGDVVPGRPRWTLVEELGGRQDGAVWRAGNAKTGEMRIFKFADTPAGLRALRQEVTIARLLAKANPADRPFVDILEWSFDTPPFFIESADGGQDLVRWAAGEDGFAITPVERRVAIVAVAARAVAAAHALGVLHKDVKPTNIVIGSDRVVRLLDFGSGAVIDDHALRAFAITDPGDAEAEDGRGTPAYLAPELAKGAPYSIATDVYALGLLLYQMIVGDLTRPLAPGWEADIADPLLRDDIAAAAAGDPARRLPSAAMLADRLDTLAERRSRVERDRIEGERTARAAAAEQRRRARAPWVRAAAVAGGLGLVATSAATILAITSRNAAQAERQSVEAAYDFLTDDLLARVSPRRANAAEETLTEAVLRARSDIDRRFADRPLLAARLHVALAGALHERSQWDEARRSYRLADAAFVRAKSGASDEARENRLAWAGMEAASAQPGSLDRAKHMVATERTQITDPDRGAVGVKLAQAEGAIAYFGDPATAPAKFDRAVRLADALPDLFKPFERLRMRQSAAMGRLRTGDTARAERELRAVATQMAALKGADDPDALLARMSAIIAAAYRGQDATTTVAEISAMLPLAERRFGPNHRYTLALLSQRGDALMVAGRLREAARDAERVWRAALAREGPGQQAQVGELDLAIVLCRDGQADAGVRHARAARTAVIAGGGPEQPLAHTANFVLGECLTAAGDARDALTLYDAVDPVRVGQQMADPHWQPNLDLARAEAYLKLGDRQKARDYVSHLGTAFRERKDAYQRDRSDRLRRALSVS